MSAENKQRKEVKLQTCSGSECIINLHGAHVTSWKNNGEEILFLSKKAIFDGKTAIRGGIPIAFPLYGPWEHGRPQHGFARLKTWEIASSATQSGDEHSSQTFVLEDDDETRSMWNERFRLEYTVKLSNDSLKSSLKVFNRGDRAFNFTTLLHNYFRFDNIENAMVKGVQGLQFLNYFKRCDGEQLEERDVLTFDGPFDNKYRNFIGVQMFPDKEQRESCRRIIAENMPDIVVWNPWKERAKAIPDFGDDEYRNMLCVEPGCVSEPISLDAGKALTFSQTIIVDRNSKM